MLYSKFNTRNFNNISQSMQLDGNDDGILVPNWLNGVLSSNNDWAMSFIINQDSSNGVADYRIFNGRSSITAGNRGIDVVHKASAKSIELRIYTGATILLNSSIILQDHIENHLVISYSFSTSEFYFYLDSVLVDTLSFAGSDFYDSELVQFHIATFNDLSQYYACNLTSFRLFNRLPTLQEIIFEYENQNKLLPSIAQHCVFELDLESPIFEADVTFAANHTGISNGDFVVTDTSYKYNHLKELYGTTPITSFSSNGSGGTTVTYNTHGLNEYDVVNIYSAGAYTGRHIIFNRTTNTFDIDVTFGVNEVNGKWGTSIDKPAHGILLGQSDSELGVSNYSSKTTLKNFYNKRNQTSSSMLIKDDEGYLSGTDSLIDYGSAFTIYVEILDTLLNDDNDIIICGKTSASSFDFYYSYGLDGSNNITSLTFRVRDAANLDYAVTFSETIPIVKGINTFILSHDGSDAINSRVNINGINYSVELSIEDVGFNPATVNFGTTLNIGEIPGSSGARRTVYFNKFEVDSTYYSNEDLINIYINEGLSTPLLELSFDGVGESEQKSKQGGTYTQNSYDSEDIGSITWLNNKSFIPPSLEMYQSDGTPYIEGSGFSGFSTSDYYTLIFTVLGDDLKLPNSQTILHLTDGTDDLLTIEQYTSEGRLSLGAQASNTIDPIQAYDYNEVEFNSPLRFDNYTTFVVTWKNDGSDNYELNTLFINGYETDFTFNSGAGTLAPVRFGDVTNIALGCKVGGSNIFEKNIAKIGLIPRQLTDKELSNIEIFNNLDKKIIEDSEFYYQLQSGSIYDDGVSTEPVIKDWSTNNRNLEIFNLSGATQNDKIIDYQGNYINNINLQK